jgi:hypothetical protein
MADPPETINWVEKFREALPCAEFLARHGTAAHRERWRRVYQEVSLTAAQRALLASFGRATDVLCLAGAWCGDCSGQCPIFEHFAAAAPALRVRYLDRDAHPDVQRELRINGGHRVPVVVFLSEDGFDAARYGERTLSRYRQMVSEQAGAGCPTGLVPPGDGLLAAVTKDWLVEF